MAFCTSRLHFQHLPFNHALLPKTFQENALNCLPGLGTHRYCEKKSFVTQCHSDTQVSDAVNRASCPPIKPNVEAAAFSALDLRVGLITDAKPVFDPEMSERRGKTTNSRRYLQLTIDIGCEVRTVVSECKYVMDVEDAVGKKVIVVANVTPEEILGVTSHGLVLSGFNYDPTPMPRTFKVILPGLGRLPPGSQISEVSVP